MTRLKELMILKKSARSLVLVLVIAVMVFSVSGCDLFKPKSTTSVTTGGSPTTTKSSPTSTAVTTPATTTPVVTTTTVAPTTTSTTTAPTTTQSSTLTTTTGVTEQRMGFVVSTAATGTPSITIDYIEFYTGETAIEKALEDGSDVVEMDEYGYYIPNDYYIRNNNTRLRTFPINVGCLIKMIPELSGPDASETVTYTVFAQRVNERKRLMTINVINGSVTWMEEFYTP